MSKQGRQETLRTELIAVGRQLSAATMAFQQAVAERLGLNPTDHTCLQLLIGAGAITAGQLSALTGLSAGAVTGIVDRLETAGFVRREKDPADRRRVIIQPVAEEVERRVHPLFKPVTEAAEAALQQYSEKEVALILNHLSRSLAVLQKETARLKEEDPGSDPER
jgi:DNA-binding MarR family transcriptional regulator